MPRNPPQTLRSIAISDHALTYIRACGPVTMGGIRHDVAYQYGATQQWEVPQAVTDLIRSGTVELYEDGKSFIVTTA